ncbi:MAG: sigma-70 family RNA polymerase sigma factor [Proteiniphilum sp.]|jgi:RNA polymerase sigma factor (sigma-70 family)|uniref:RNA polymerase sigma factor n=1 Tax=Proteiniphilum sp. TaxID=1926877 RepID=UPI0009275549|nr:sigma-70 family RNA polymerase sigma factor [Proteiniphilum sp.]MEA5127065.1 sigma-70 family RNA polymerase sigma factor [Proteiniphilum sp.]OJV75559.1 MAG: RNA polymerase subunit sigma-70 [Bacteroidia bacterium 44-10]
MNKQEQQQFFKEIIEQHKGILFKVARVYCPNENDSQDLIQEMMIQVWQSIHKYNDQFKISTWLYRISLNVAISFYRKNTTRANRFTVLNEQTTEILTEDKAETEQQLNLLEQFISELKELDKALILLYLEDKSHTEIAEVLGLSISNVGTKVGRIKKKLKTRFSQLTP